jgi:hypothetical protein
VRSGQWLVVSRVAGGLAHAKPRSREAAKPRRKPQRGSGWWAFFEYEYEYEYRPPGRTEYEYERRFLGGVFRARARF